MDPCRGTDATDTVLISRLSLRLDSAHWFINLRWKKNCLKPEGELELIAAWICLCVWGENIPPEGMWQTKGSGCSVLWPKEYSLLLSFYFSFSFYWIDLHICTFWNMRRMQFLPLPLCKQNESLNIYAIIPVAHRNCSWNWIPQTWSLAALF